ncbi:alpha/beta hydrolase fold domain-containing protein [Nonomuraea sp. NPDC050680]|uniref:alpha/beta hydrolase n=1 Tax=Nonomuraea sp. NPDC050680 TaxID=3154630 RepID=UPI0033E863E5
MRDVLVVVGPGLVADAALLSETAEREFAALGVSGELVHARDAAEVMACTAAGDGEFSAAAVVVVPGPVDEVRRLMGQCLGPLVWLDLARVDGAEVGEGATHIHGRGVEGLIWAIRHAVHRLRYPRTRIAYGTHRDQWGELYLPEGLLPRSATCQAEGDRPAVVALVHGGNWRSNWAADLMDALCLDLLGRGLAVWNLEYRRPDLHGWRATAADVAAGLAALSTVDAPIDLDRVAVVGHSAGAQLAFRAVADGARVSLVVSLAGVLDLVEGDRRWLGSGAVAAALGTAAGSGLEVGTASPVLRLPLRVRQLIVQGSGDELDLVDFARRYARAAQEAGDDVTYLEMSGDHFAVIDPQAPIWRTTALAITDALR